MEVFMPKFGLMEKGEIAEWFKSEGDKVVEGEPLCGIAAEKLSNILDAPVDGVLTKIVVKEGEEVAVASLIAIIKE